MKKYWIPMALLVVSGFISSCGSDNANSEAQTTAPADPTVLPEPIAAFLNKNYPGLDIRSWEFKEDEYEVVFLLEGKTYESAFDASYNWFITERPIDEEELPEAVAAALATSDFSTWEIIDIQILSMPDFPELFMYELANETGDGEEIFFDRQGNVVQTQRE